MPGEDRPDGPEDLCSTGQEDSRPTDRMESGRVPCDGQADPRPPDREEPGGAPREGRESAPHPPAIPPCIDRYKIIRTIGAGGMGTVYEAEQENPLRRVALKVMHPGLASPEALQRFQHEVQMLAQLKHPGVARIFEAGTCDGSDPPVPYFAMEYIPGARSLIAYAAGHALDTRARLELFAEVCDAVHHGHQKGIIHRDLKPANILVDENGKPRIIDFGIARATGSDLVVTTCLTQTGLLLGTPQYMSPEQFRGDPDDVDVRSDVYALGVVLYELLTREFPYPARSLPAMIFAVLQEPPHRPSAVRPELRGDLETIILKALEKDRESRYQSALELKQDLVRYLGFEPIAAHPPRLVHQLRLFARRNRLAAGLAVTAAFTLAAGAVVSTVMAVRAERARAAAVAAEARTRTANTFLASLLRSANPQSPRAGSLLASRSGDLSGYAATAGREATVGDLLRRAAFILDRQSFEPELEAVLRLTVGETLAATGSPGIAEKQVRRALELREKTLGPDHAETVAALEELAVVAWTRGALEEAGRYYREAYRRALRSLGAGHPVTLRCAAEVGRTLASLGHLDEAIGVLRSSLREASQVRGARDPQVLLHSLALARLLVSGEESREALAMARNARDGLDRALGRECPEYATACFQMGVIHIDLKQWAEAEPCLRQALDLYCALYGGDHPEAIAAVDCLGWALEEQGRLQDALPMREQALEIASRYYPPTHPTVIGAMNSLAYTLVQLRREPARAERLSRDAVALASRVFGPQDMHTLNFRDTLGTAVRLAGKLPEAEVIFRENVAIAGRITREGDWWPLAVHQLGLGRCLREEGRLAEAEIELLSANRRIQALGGGSSSAARDAAAELMALYEAWKRPRAAARWRSALAGLNDPALAAASQ